jgi:uncharacterized membrane protein YkoI
MTKDITDTSKSGRGPHGPHGQTNVKPRTPRTSRTHPSLAADGRGRTDKPKSGRGHHGQTSVLALAALLSVCAAARADTKVQLKDLPPVVRATVDAETKGATLKGLSKEREKGKTVYEVETVVNGRSRDLMVDGAGNVYEVEEQIDPAKAPAAVKAALEAKGRIVALELVTSRGKTTYEGRVQTRAGKKTSLTLDAAGRPIKP